jgi:hypothetical protein
MFGFGTGCHVCGAEVSDWDAHRRFHDGISNLTRAVFFEDLTDSEWEERKAFFTIAAANRDVGDGGIDINDIRMQEVRKGDHSIPNAQRKGPH